MVFVAPLLSNIDLGQAYEILSDAEKRKTYDQYGLEYILRGGAAPPAATAEEKPEKLDNSDPLGPGTPKFRRHNTDSFAFGGGGGGGGPGMPHTPGRSYSYATRGYAADPFRTFDMFMASNGEYDGLGSPGPGGPVPAHMYPGLHSMPGSPMRDHTADGRSPHIQSRFREERDARRERERDAYRDREREKMERDRAERSDRDRDRDRSDRDRDRDRESRDRYASDMVNGRVVERDSHRDSMRSEDGKHKSNGRSKTHDSSVVERKLFFSLEEYVLIKDCQNSHRHLLTR